MEELNENIVCSDEISAADISATEVSSSNAEDFQQEEVNITEMDNDNKATEDNNDALAKYLRAERELLDRERAALILAESELKAKREEEIRSNHLVNISTFFWLHYLFNIPVIGFIAAIVFSFAGSNISRKNYARARMIWHLIWIFIMVAITLAVILVFRFFGDNIKGILVGLFADLL